MFKVFDSDHGRQKASYVRMTEIGVLESCELLRIHISELYLPDALVTTRTSLRKYGAPPQHPLA